MPIQSGTHLGPYEIISAIGAGGMGEVYRARDPKLGRDVAIKVLPEAFARDAERMARFQREAKVLASLDHPNIASIYGLEDSGGTRALVMQLVEGPTLADRIKAGPIPVDESVRIARQIADALEYAHERGIIHRDLKPANVKVTNDDAVKVLDFGLAKALEGDPSSIDISTSPTISRMATQAGVLLGTAAYMSPEQAKAKSVDRRADIWAFGCVLYEMLTGKQAFTGETVTDTLASIIKEDPDWSQLPSATPMRVRVLLQRCLQKDPKQRLRDIGDARISLDEVLSGAPEGAPFFTALGGTAKRWLWILAGLAVVFVLATALLAFLYFRQKPPTAQAMRFEIPLPEKFNLVADFALSPDGRKLAFIGTGADTQSRLWVRAIDALNAQPLQGTEGAGGWPFWSPDGRFIVFRGGNSLKKIESTGGPPVTLCDSPSMLGGAWTRDDKIVFGTPAGLMQVSAAGGSPSPITAGGLAATPSLLPDGKHFVYLGAATSPSRAGIYMGSVDTKPEQQPSNRLLADVSTVVYTPSPDPAIGYLVFVRGAFAPGGVGTLMAQPFDTRRLGLTREAVPIAEQVLNLSFSASATDALVYVTGSSSGVPTETNAYIRGQLTWFDREGKVLGAFGDSGVYRELALSPDGKRVAFERVDPQNLSTRNIWLYDFARGVTTRFTFDSAWDAFPLWSPDGSHVAFGSNRGGGFDLYQKASNLAGEDELLYKSEDAKVPTSWSPDGRFLLYFSPATPNRMWLLPLGGGGGDRKAILIERSEFNEGAPRFSPDGRWIAYSSNESGKDQIYVRPFDASVATGPSSARGTAGTGKWMVSKDGGLNPIWRRDGKELFYLSSVGGTAMAVDVNTSGVFQAGVPKLLFKVPPGVLFWDVSADGKRFLMAAPSAESAAEQPKFTVVLNWQAGLKK
jgi:eukaryotic-like serine/threonine-protein kinase